MQDCQFSVVQQEPTFKLDTLTGSEWSPHCMITDEMLLRVNDRFMVQTKYHLEEMNFHFIQTKYHLEQPNFRFIHTNYRLEEKNFHFVETKDRLGTIKSSREISFKSANFRRYFVWSEIGEIHRISVKFVCITFA